MMVLFLSRLRHKKHEWVHLAEEFPLKSKIAPVYTQELQGVKLTGKNAHKILEEFANT